jgi:hypothetical protein
MRRAAKYLVGVSRAAQAARFRLRSLRARTPKASRCAPTLLAVVLLGIYSAPAFAQRGGGFHGSAGTEGHGGLHAAASDRADSSISHARGSSSLASGTSRIESPTYDAVSMASENSSSAASRSSYAGASDDILGRHASAYPREVTIGFPPPAAGSASLSRGNARGTVIEGQGSELWADGPQRGAGAPHAGAPIGSAPAGRAPMARPPVMRLPRPPVTRGYFVPPFRAGGRVAARHSFAFLRRPIGFPPRPGQPIFIGVGFFWFGYPYWGFLTPGCNPFWAWPWVYGCSSFGYWDGYSGFGPAFDSSAYGQDNEEETGQQAQEPETFAWSPPPESSPEEIEAEKPITVLFLQNGAVYAITDYWIQDGKFYYATSYGGQNSINLDDIDLQKTVEVNAKRGVEFILKPSPDRNPQNPPPPGQQNPTDLHM